MPDAFGGANCRLLAYNDQSGESVPQNVVRSSKTAVVVLNKRYPPRVTVLHAVVFCDALVSKQTQADVE